MGLRGGNVFELGTEALMFKEDGEKMLAVLLWNGNRNRGNIAENRHRGLELNRNWSMVVGLMILYTGVSERRRV